MKDFDRRMAIAEIEDALTGVDTPYGRGIAIGLCSAFYMCELLSEAEWETFMTRIQTESCEIDILRLCGISPPGAGADGWILN